MEENNPIQKFDAYAAEAYGKAKFGLSSIIAPITSLLAASIWAFISYVGNAQIGYVAVGIGIIVGGTIKILCNPVGKSFAITAMIYSFIGVLLGNLWTIGLFATEGTGLSFFQLINGMDYGEAFKYHIENFDGYDIAFYGLSVGAAFRLSYVRLTYDELDFMLKEKGIEIQKKENGISSLVKRRRK
jgi:hypothetical protein